MAGLDSTAAAQRPTLAGRMERQMKLERLRARELACVALLSLWLLARRAMRTVALWSARARQRQALSELSEHLLRDIGVDRVRARAEARKWFWRP